MIDTLASMDAVVGPATPEGLERVRAVESNDMSTLLKGLLLGHDVLEELVDQWDEVRRSPRWSSLLAALVTRVERDRGHLDADVAIWGDLDEYGPSGRLLYYYLFALLVDGLREYHHAHGVPDDVSDATISALARHGETHLLKCGTSGVDAGWWMLPILGGEILQVGSLKFHLVHLDGGTLAPRPWLDATTADLLGDGFRSGDSSLGVHIPARIDLSPVALDSTFARAREVLSVVWPTTTRRLATCQSWMMDDRLLAVLGENSNIVRFQRRFTLIEPYADDVNNVVEFVFRQPGTDIAHLRGTSRLQRAVLDVLANGDTWHNRTGWLDLD
jgi:hypothetical protein